LSISNINKWKVYVNEVLEYGRSLTILVPLRHNLLQKLLLRKRKSKWKEKLKIGHEGERIPPLVKHMKMKDEEVLVDNDVDDSDEEGSILEAVKETVNL
jgi:hypothetical protein